MLAALAVTLVIALAVRAQVLSQNSPSSAKGRQGFEQYERLLCHSLEGRGGTLSVALDGVALVSYLQTRRKTQE